MSIIPTFKKTNFSTTQVYQYIALFCYTIASVHVWSILNLSNSLKNTTENIRLSISYTLLLILASFLEEFVFRYLSYRSGVLGGFWTILMPVVPVGILISALFKISLFSYVGYYLLIAVPAVCIIYFFKNSALYKQIFLPSTTRVIISVIAFSLLHIFNYDVTSSTVILAITWLLVSIVPFSLFMSHLQYNIRYGFWFAWMLHFLHNFMISLIQYFL